MVKLTFQYLIKICENVHKPNRLKNESDANFLKRLVHLKLQERNIDYIEKIDFSLNVSYLYLHNNLLQKISNLENFSKLTHLYLQRNKISKIENLEGLVNLKKLYLGYNSITVIEGLDTLKNLREMHVEYQRLPLGESLYFDPRSVTTLSRTLEVFNITGNGLTTLVPLMNMFQLKELHVNDNYLKNLKETSDALSSWPKLIKIYISGNPMTMMRDFRNTIILYGKNLRYIDGTAINPTTRTFLEGWNKARGKSGPKNEDPSSGLSTRRTVTFFQHTNPRDILPINPVNTSDNKVKPVLFQPWQIRGNNKSFSKLPSFRLHSPAMCHRPVIEGEK